MILALIFSSLLWGGVVSQALLTNKQVQRTIDLRHQVGHYSTSVTLENRGNAQVHSFLLCFETEAAEKLSYLAVTKAGKELKVKPSSSVENAVFYEVFLDAGLAAGGFVDVSVVYVLNHKMIPFPTEIMQSENQMVKFFDNHYWFSPYHTESVKTRVELPSSTIQSNSDLSPSSVKGDLVSYGPYKDIPPFSISQLFLHFENNRPFLTVKSVERLIEISHWGNVAVEEMYIISNDGAKLKGTFSRYHYQINATANGQSAAEVISQYLPEKASGVYYRDDIGNISTSTIRHEGGKQLLELKPRFPLFGGWHTEFLVGYNLPSENALAINQKTGRYTLKIPFLAEFTSPIDFDSAVVKVVLPEGSSDFNVNVPFDVKQTQDTLYTYLDYNGRPVIVLSKNNLANQHAVNFEVSYSFSSTSLLFEPFLLVVGYFSFFLIIIVAVRLDCSLYDEKGHLVNDPKIISALENLNRVFEEREKVHMKVEENFNTYKRSSDEKTYERERKALNVRFSELRKKVAEIKSSVSSNTIVNAITELEKKQEEKEQLQFDFHNANLAGLKGKIEEIDYGKARDNFEAKQEEIVEDLEKLLLI